MPGQSPNRVRCRSVNPVLRNASLREPRRTPTLQGRMFLLVAAVALPLLLLSAAVAFFVFADEGERAEDRVRLQTRTLALVVDQELAKAEILLNTLAGSSSLARGDLEAFTAEAVAASTMFGIAPIGLIGVDHRQILNTACRHEQQAVCDRAVDPLPAVLASGHAEITDVMQGGVTGRPSIAVGIPVFAQQGWPDAGKRLAYTVGLVLPTGLIAATLNQQSPVAGQIVSVLDRTGAVVARTEGEAGVLGQHLGPELMAAVAQSSQGSSTGCGRCRGHLPLWSSRARRRAASLSSSAFRRACLRHRSGQR